MSEKNHTKITREKKKERQKTVPVTLMQSYIDERDWQTENKSIFATFAYRPQFSQPADCCAAVCVDAFIVFINDVHIYLSAIQLSSLSAHAYSANVYSSNYVRICVTRRCYCFFFENILRMRIVEQDEFIVFLHLIYS